MGELVSGFLYYGNNLSYESAKAVKCQIIANVITHHHEKEVKLLELTPWALFFNGSTCKQGGGVGMFWFHHKGWVLNSYSNKAEIYQ